MADNILGLLFEISAKAAAYRGGQEARAKGTGLMQSENANRNLSLKHLAGGRHGVFDEDGNQIGTVDHKHLVQHMFDASRLSSVLPGSSSVDREVARRTRELMAETGVTVGAAMKAVFRQDQRLAERYSAEHTKVLGS